MKRKKIVILGATGSIGDSALQVIQKHADKLELIGISAEKNIAKLSKIATDFNVPYIGITNEQAYTLAKKENYFPPSSALFAGKEALKTLATLPEADILIVATNGVDSLPATLAAISLGRTIALANKESLILGGSILMQEARNRGAKILPLDSEHSAVHQCLEGNNIEKVKRVILTASGGALRDIPYNQLQHVTPESALKHPTWNMGSKITIDCATMANKGLELFEAFWLFGLAPTQIDAILHPQSLIHSFVEFIDGSMLAQIGPTHMTFPIQYALLHPHRHPSPLPGLSLENISKLELAPIDNERYKCFKLAKDILLSGNSSDFIIYNAANEIAVDAFLKGAIGFLSIPEIIENTLNKLSSLQTLSSLDTLLHIDNTARLTAQQCIQHLTKTTHITHIA